MLPFATRLMKVTVGEGLRMPALYYDAWLWGRRPEASREGTRGMEIAAFGLWGFDGSAWFAVAAPMRLADGKD